MKTILMQLVFSLLSFGLYAQCFISGTGSLGTKSKTTGNHTLDTKFNNTKADLENVFNINVDLYVYNDGYSPNAYAICSGGYADGTVAFGMNMLTQRLWNMWKGEYAVAGVMAHEFAHVLQCKKGNTLATKKKELQADWLSGYYFGKRSFLSSGLRSWANDLFTLGDFNFWHPKHHGTPNERVAAMMEGYENSYRSISSAYQESYRYVTGESYSDDDDDDDFNYAREFIYSKERSANTPKPKPKYKECYRCDGDGYVSSTKNCNQCSGYGAIGCRNCGGGGITYGYGYNAYGQYGYWAYKCGNCYGNGRFRCTKCRGSGKVKSTSECSKCDGRGKIRY